MKVFISWSGEHTKQVAEILRDWIPDVINRVEPFLSSRDLQSGSRWNAELARELADSSVGIICVDRTSIDSRWVNFEAGAISKSVEESRVIPFLSGLRKQDVSGPLSAFHMTTRDRDDVFGMMSTLNHATEKPRTEDALRRVFDLHWPQLETALDAIEGEQLELVTVEAPATPNDAILSELIELARENDRRIQSLAQRRRLSDGGAESLAQAGLQHVDELAPGDFVRHSTYGYGRLLGFHITGGTLMARVTFGNKIRNVPAALPNLAYDEPPDVPF